MKYKRHPFLYGLFTVFCCICAACGTQNPTGETSALDNELRNKPEWSALQTLAFQSKDSPLVTTASLSKINGYCVVALVPTDGKRTVWVLLDAKVEPYLKRMPENEFRLTESELNKILKSCTPNPAVLSFLRQHVSD